jgi:hypothetical protein
MIPPTGTGHTYTHCGSYLVSGLTSDVALYFERQMDAPVPQPWAQMLCTTSVDAQHLAAAQGRTFSMMVTRFARIRHVRCVLGSYADEEYY